MTEQSGPPERLLPRIGDLWLSYFKGQFIISALIGGLTWAASAGIGLPGAAVLGALAGVFESIPGLGPLVAIVPAVVIAFWQGSRVIPVQNWVFALIVVGVFLAVQQIGNLVIEPRVHGKRLQLPPLLVLVVVVAGAALAGVVGAFFAVPVVATIREMILYARNRRSQGAGRSK